MQIVKGRQKLQVWKQIRQMAPVAPLSDRQTNDP